MRTCGRKPSCAVICALVLTTLLAMLCAPSAAAAEPEYKTNKQYYIPEASMQISVPSDYYVLTRDMDADDPALEALGMTSEEARSMLTEIDVYLDALSPDGQDEIVVIVKPSEYMTLESISDEELREEVEEDTKEVLDGLGATLERFELVDHAGSKYIKVYASMPLDGVTDSLIDYLTVRNYRIIQFTVHSIQRSGSAPQPPEALAQRVLSSISFTDRESTSGLQSKSTSGATRIAYRVGEAFSIAVLLSIVFDGVRALVRKKKKTPPEEETSWARQRPDPAPGADGMGPGEPRVSADEPAPGEARTAAAPPPDSVARPKASTLFCGKCGKAVPESSARCPFCGAPVRVSFDEIVAETIRREDARAEAEAGSAPKRLCRRCGSPLEDGRLYCGVCGTKYGEGARKKKRGIRTILLVAAVVAALAAAFALGYRPLLQGMVRRAERCAVQRQFAAGYETLERFEKLNLPGLGLDADVAGYDALKEYLLAGKYYEDGLYREAQYHFGQLGDYRESRALAEACGKQTPLPTAASGSISSSEKPFSQDTDAIASACRSVFTLDILDSSGEPVATGSAFAAFEKGLLVTNFHVIKDAGAIRAVDEDGRELSVSAVLAYDETQDLALLRMDAVRDYPMLTPAAASALRKGESVVAIGSPLGLHNMVSTGTVSGYSTIDRQEYIQFTAPISQGSSGGALMNDSGEVVGVTSAFYIDGQNLNLAIPIDRAAALYHGAGDALTIEEFRALQHPMIKYETYKVGVRFLIIPPEQEGSATALEAARLRAEAIYDEWLSGEATEDSMGKTMKKYGPSQGAGKLLIIEPGYFVGVADAWCFDRSRRPGDTVILLDDFYGYIILYFSCVIEG